MRSFYNGMCLILLSFVLSGCTKTKQPPSPMVLQGKEKEVQCYQMFTALKSLDNPTFKKYQQQFSVINDNYEIYKKNQSLIDDYSAEVISTELNNKVDIVCARIRHAVFTSMSTRANELNKL